MCDLSPNRTATGQFLPGHSGNPAGRPPGSRNRSSLLVELIDEGESAMIVRAVVDRALAGEWPALRACFARLVPPAKEAPIEIDLPPIVSAADVAAAGTALIAALAAGEITPGEAQKVMNVLARQLKLLDAAPQSRVRGQADVDAGASRIAEDACISPVFGDATEGAEARYEPSLTRRRHLPAPPDSCAASRSAPALDAANACISPVLGGGTQAFPTAFSGGAAISQGAQEACPEQRRRADRASTRRAGGMTQPDRPEPGRKGPVLWVAHRRLGGNDAYAHPATACV